MAVAVPRFKAIQEIGCALAEMVGVDPKSCIKLEITLYGSSEVHVLATMVPHAVDADPIIEHFRALAFERVDDG